MSKVKSKGTSLEKTIRRVLKENNIRYISNPKMYGRPDISIQKKRIAIFLDGCFWHGCKKCNRVPNTNKTYWVPKINANIKRDKIVSKNLKKDGWIVLRFWEHQIDRNPNVVIERLENLTAKY